MYIFITLTLNYLYTGCKATPKLYMGAIYVLFFVNVNRIIAI